MRFQFTGQMRSRRVGAVGPTELTTASHAHRLTLFMTLLAESSSVQGWITDSRAEPRECQGRAHSHVMPIGSWS